MSSGSAWTATAAATRLRRLPPASSCGCQAGFTNFCDDPPDTPGCPMTAPGGYCDSNGDGSYYDGDWVRGYDEYPQQCP